MFLTNPNLSGRKGAAMTHFVILFFIGLVFGAPVRAITMDEAVNQALKNNPEFQTLRLEDEVTKSQLEKARLPLIANPIVESYLSGKEKPQEEGGGKYTNYGLKLSQEFEIAGQRGLRIDIAEKELSRIALEIRDKERTLTYEVKDAFSRALAAKRKEELTRQVVTLQEDLLNFTRVKFQSGEVSGLEVNLAEVELSKSKRELLLATREYHEALLGMQGLMGGKPDIDLNLVGELSSGLLSLPDREDLKKLIQSPRPDMKAVLTEVDKTKTAIDLAQKGIVPNIVLGGFYNRDELRNDLGVSVSISIPLFDRKQAERKEAKVRAAQARVKQAGLERRIDREFEEAYNTLSSSQKELLLFKKEILDKSLENLVLLNLAYKEGKIGFFNVRLAQKETIETQFAYLDTLFRLQRARHAMERTIGGDLK
jgi:cobalt-zinc-cadmium efflux system outer membrane protein